MREGLQSPEILIAGDLSTQLRGGCMLPACGQKGLKLKRGRREDGFSALFQKPKIML